MPRRYSFADLKGVISGLFGDTGKAKLMQSGKTNCYFPDFRPVKYPFNFATTSAATSHSHRLEHFFQTGPFQGRMRRVGPARKIGRGQPPFREPRAVGAAADDRQLGPCGPGVQRLLGE